MALCGKVVDFVRFYFPNHLQNAHRIAKVSVMEVEVRMPFQVGDTLAVIYGGSSYGAMYVITLFQ